MDIGSALRRHREEAGLSQTKLSKATGITQQNISRWEKNLVAPTVEACIILAKYYGITLEELLNVRLP